MKIRRVVTGHTPDGKSTIASDTKVDAITVAMLPGTEFYNLWGADVIPTFPNGGSPQPAPTYFPPTGGFRFGMFTVPPQSVVTPGNLDMGEALKEMEEKLPGVMAHMEPANSGMHTTNTIDFEYVISDYQERGRRF